MLTPSEQEELVRKHICSAESLLDRFSTLETAPDDGYIGFMEKVIYDRYKAAEAIRHPDVVDPPVSPYVVWLIDEAVAHAHGLIAEDMLVKFEKTPKSYYGSGAAISEQAERVRDRYVLAKQAVVARSSVDEDIIEAVGYACDVFGVSPEEKKKLLDIERGRGVQECSNEEMDDLLKAAPHNAKTQREVGWIKALYDLPNNNHERAERPMIPPRQSPDQMNQL